MLLNAKKKKNFINSIKDFNFTTKNIKIEVKILLDDQRIVQGILIAIDSFMNVILENSEEFRNREKKTRKKKKNLDFFTFLSQKTKTIDNIQNQLKIVYSDSCLSFVKKTTKKENLNSLSDFKNISTNSFFQKENLGWERRKLGLCLIRGDQIISISFD